MVAITLWGYLRSPASPWPTSGYRERGSNTLLSLINPICVKSLINNHVNQLINKHPSLSLSLPEKVGAFKSNRQPEGAVEVVIKFYHFVLSIASPNELSLSCCMRVKPQMSFNTDIMINFASKKFRDDMIKKCINSFRTKRTLSTKIN